MTVPVDDPINQFVIVGGETQGTWTWFLGNENELVVTKQLATTGEIVLLTLNTDYTVNALDLGNEPGGTITFLPPQIPVVAGDVWTLSRDTTINRSPDFPFKGNFDAVTVNAQLDKLTRLAQDLDRDVTNAIRKDPGVGDTLNPLIPAPVDDRALKFKDTGGGNFEMVMSEFDPDQPAADAADSAAAALASEQAAAISETNAATSETNAANSETAAGISETAAGISETNAANSAAAAGISETFAAISATAASDQLSGTSTTFLTIQLGARVFTTQANKFFEPGTNLKIKSDADPNNFMFGDVTTYSGTTLTMNITAIGGSGTKNDWTISLSGLRGVPGDIFRGALVYKTADQAISNATFNMLTWDVEEYDTDSIHSNVTNNSRLTVPAGVTRVKVICHIDWDGNTSGDRIIDIRRNGNTSGTVGVGGNIIPSTNFGDLEHHATTATLTVVSGDYFEVFVFQTSGGSVDVQHVNGTKTWFAMEIIE